MKPELRRDVSDNRRSSSVSLRGLSAVRMPPLRGVRLRQADIGCRQLLGGSYWTLAVSELLAVLLAVQNTEAEALNLNIKQTTPLYVTGRGEM